MKKISLLPPEIRKERNLRHKQRFYIIVSVSVLGVFLLTYISLLLITLNINSQADTLEDQRHSIERQIAELEHIAEMQAKVDKTEVILQQALGEVPDWEILLREVSALIPDDVWLSDLNATFADESGEMSMRGWGRHHYFVATWLRKTKEMEGMENIRCQFSTETTVEDRKAFQFEIRGNLEPGQPLERILEGDAE